MREREREINEDITKYHKLFFIPAKWLLWTVNAEIVQVSNSYELRAIHFSTKNGKISQCVRAQHSCKWWHNKSENGEDQERWRCVSEKDFIALTRSQWNIEKLQSPLFLPLLKGERKHGEWKKWQWQWHYPSQTMEYHNKIRTIRKDCFQ